MGSTIIPCGGGGGGGVFAIAAGAEADSIDVARNDATRCPFKNEAAVLSRGSYELQGAALPRLDDGDIDRLGGLRG